VKNYKNLISLYHNLVLKDVVIYYNNAKFSMNLGVVDMIEFVGIICIVIGFIFKVFPPRKINSIYGYRTSLSMKNQDTWNEAQKYSANTFIILGFIYVALGFVLSHLIGNISIGYESIVILIGFTIMIVLDEVHLKKVFSKDGGRKL